MTQFFRKIYLSLYLKGFERVTKGFYCVRGELEAEQNCNILTPHSYGHNSVSFPFSWSAQPEAWSPASLRHVPHSSIFSPTSCAPSYIIIWRPLFFLLASQFSHSIQPVHGPGYILIFLEWLYTGAFPILTAWPGSMCYITIFFLSSYQTKQELVKDYYDIYDDALGGFIICQANIMPNMAKLLARWFCDAIFQDERDLMFFF